MVCSRHGPPTYLITFQIVIASVFVQFFFCDLFIMNIYYVCLSWNKFLLISPKCSLFIVNAWGWGGGGVVRVCDSRIEIPLNFTKTVHLELFRRS